MSNDASSGNFPGATRISQPLTDRLNGKLQR